MSERDPPQDALHDLAVAEAEIERAALTERLTAEAQAALDAVRRAINNWGDPVPPFAERVVTALENLDARLKALEGK